MSHGFQTLSGFLISGQAGSERAPLWESFITIDSAAHQCSVEPRCRGFTLSVLHLQDDRLHFVSFFSHTSVALSSEWLTYVKEPLSIHHYHFAPGYLVMRGSDDSAPTPDNSVSSLSNSTRRPPLHQSTTQLFDAMRFCDAEPSCEGFTLRRTPLMSARASADDASSADAAWTVFLGPRVADRSERAHERDPDSAGGIQRGANVRAWRWLQVVFDSAHVSYVKGRALPTPHAPGLITSLRPPPPFPEPDGMDAPLPEADEGLRPFDRPTGTGRAQPVEGSVALRRLFTVHFGFLGGRGTPIRHAKMSVAAGRQWCEASPLCAGFSLPAVLGIYEVGGSSATPGEALAWLTFWAGGTRLAFSEDWVSYVRGDAAWLSPYLQQRGYLGIGPEAPSAGAGDERNGLMYEGSMSIDEARWWCDRHEACVGFSMNVAVPPSSISKRTDEENARSWVRFSRVHAMWHVAAGVGGEAAGWVTYSKMGSPPIGMAANVAASPSAPVTWLPQPGFIVAPAPTAEEVAAGTAQLLRVDDAAAPHDVLEWCAAHRHCEGFTAGEPSLNIPIDRVQTACYCCRVDVRVSRAQQSWTKWAVRCVPLCPSSGRCRVRPAHPPQMASHNLATRPGCVLCAAVCTDAYPRRPTVNRGNAQTRARCSFLCACLATSRVAKRSAHAREQCDACVNTPAHLCA